MTIRVERDVLARPIRITETPGGRGEEIELRWDAAGRLVERRAGDTAVGWSYDPDGLRTGLTHPDGSVTAIAATARAASSRLEHPLSGGWTCSATRTGGCSP